MYVDDIKRRDLMDCFHIIALKLKKLQVKSPNGGDYLYGNNVLIFLYNTD